MRRMAEDDFHSAKSIGPTLQARRSCSWHLNRLPADSSLEPIDLDSRFGTWLVKRLRAVGPAVHVRPNDQPTAVNDVASRLFAAYRVEGGQIHLGGCQLTDLAFLRLSFAASEDGRPCVRHIFVSHDGTTVPDELASRLGLLEVEPILKFPPRIDDAALNALIAAGRRIAAKSSSSRDPSATTVEPIAQAVVWVKHASGKLQFTVGETTVENPFSGWARIIEAPPYVAEHSGTSSFHLAATDDGRIDAADQNRSCELFGRKVLANELVILLRNRQTCVGRVYRTLPRRRRACSRRTLRTCAVCRQEVSQAVLDRESVCAVAANCPRSRKTTRAWSGFWANIPAWTAGAAGDLQKPAEVYIRTGRRLKRLLVGGRQGVACRTALWPPRAASRRLGPLSPEC